MIGPADQAAGGASTALMQSMIESAEERRIEAERKARKISDQPEVVTSHVEASASHQSLNARINEHFFGALKTEESPMAQLMSRFLGALDMQQGEDETNTDLGTRVADMLVFMEMVGAKEADLDPEEQKISLKRFGVSVEALNETIAGTAEKPSAMAERLARVAIRAGISQGEGESDKDFSERVGKAVAAERKGKPDSVAALEKMTGLRDLGITAGQMIEAIRNPHGDQAQAIAEVLDDKAANDKVLDTDMRKVLQRLEDTADPKTLAELKLERTEQPDPTRVEDAETRQEREEQIGKLEAGEKLEDVQDAQETISQVNEAAIEAGGTDTPGDPAEADIAEAMAGDLLQVLAAGSETIEMEAEAEATAGRGEASAGVGTDAPEQTGQTAKAQEAAAEEDQAVVLARASEGDPGTVASEAAGSGDILSVTMDENGIYDYLKRKSQEAA